MSKSKWRGPSQARIKPDRRGPAQSVAAPTQPDPRLEASRAEIGAPLNDQERRRRAEALAAMGPKPVKLGAKRLTPEEQQRRFIEAAQAAGASEDEAAFDANLKRIAKAAE